MDWTRRTFCLFITFTALDGDDVKMAAALEKKFLRSFVLLEKRRLQVFRISKVAEAHPYQTKLLRLLKMNTLSEEQSNRGEFFARTRRDRRGMAARENVEVAGLQLQYHGTCYATISAGGGPDLFCEVTDESLGL